MEGGFFKLLEPGRRVRKRRVTELSKMRRTGVTVLA